MPASYCYLTLTGVSSQMLSLEHYFFLTLLRHFYILMFGWHMKRKILSIKDENSIMLSSQFYVYTHFGVTIMLKLTQTFIWCGSERKVELGKYLLKSKKKDKKEIFCHRIRWNKTSFWWHAITLKMLFRCFKTIF